MVLMLLLKYLQPLISAWFLFSLLFFFFLYAAESKIYLHIEKAQQTVKYIHPKEPHARIMHAEIGNCHMEIDDRPQVSK